jgi:hypothetical protein
MRVSNFGGIKSKVHRTKLDAPFAVVAENVDLYGERLQGLKTPLYRGDIVDVFNNPIDGEVETIYRAGDTWVGFKKHTFIAPDPQDRAGPNSFLFVQDGELWRSSPRQIMRATGPIKVGIDYPHEPLSVAALPGQGCKAEFPDPICGPGSSDTCDQGSDPPDGRSYKVTYVSPCMEESAPSPASEIVDVQNGDGVALLDPNTPPSNATSRRWYRSVVSSKGEVLWLLVSETSISAPGFVDSKCIFELGEALSTEHHFPPPDCLEGVASAGNLVTLVWSNRNIWASEVKLPHAYPEEYKQTVLYDIVGIQGYTEAVEGVTHYRAAVLTNGLHYLLVGKLPEKLELHEIQDWYPCVSARSIVVGEGLVIFTSEHGLCWFTGSNVKVITDQYFTEHEWKAFQPNTQRLVFWSKRLWGFYGDATLGGGFCMRISNSDTDRIEYFSTLSETYSAGYAHADVPMYVVKSASPRAELFEWCAGSTRMRYRWRSGDFVQSGLWQPVSAKVVAEYGARVRRSKEAQLAFNAWKAELRTYDQEDFFNAHPDYKPFHTALTCDGPVVAFAVYADDELFYKRDVRNIRPFRLPRIRRTVNWAIEISGTTEVGEVHVQTSHNDLVQEGGNS